jgi:hypothetical protein
MTQSTSRALNLKLQVDDAAKSDKTDRLKMHQLHVF